MKRRSSKMLKRHSKKILKGSILSFSKPNRSVISLKSNLRRRMKLKGLSMIRFINSRPRLKMLRLRSITIRKKTPRVASKWSSLIGL